MKPFFKVLLLIVAAVIALKLLPLTFALGCLLALAALVLIALGVSVVATLAIAVLVLAAILAPVWLPILLVVGFVALIRKCWRKPVAAS